MEEFVHEVAPDGQVLGTVSKSDAHRHGLLHRVVLGEVRDEDGNVVLIKQAPDRQDPGLLVSPIGGHVRASETVEAALRREALEEIGIENFDSVVVGDFIFSRHVLGRHENHLFTVCLITANPGTFTLGPEAVAVETLHHSELSIRLENSPQSFGEVFLKLATIAFEELGQRS